MTHRPTDLRVDADTLDLFIDQSNDLATISGLEQLQQSVSLDVLDVTRSLRGESITGEHLGLLEERVRESLQQDEQVGDVQSVDAKEFDRRDNRIKLDVFLIENENFEIEVGL